MSDPEDTQEETAVEPVKTKQVAIAAGGVALALTAAVAFTVAGPLGLGVAAAGVAGTGYAAHRIRNPVKGTLLHSWLTRTRRTTTKTGSLTWPFTGNQQKRALTRAGRASGQSSRSKLPSLTSTRARRSAVLSGRSAAAKTGGSRRGSGTTTSRKSSATTLPGRTKPKHVASSLNTRAVSSPGRKPSTPTKTPARLSRSTLSGASRRSATSGRGSGRSILPKTSSGRGSLTRRGPLKLTNSRSRHRPAAGSPTRGRSSSTNRKAGRGRWNPFLGTRGGQSLGGRSTGSRKTRRAGRIGGPLGSPVPGTGFRGRMRHRLTPDRNRNRAPNRTSLRPRPYAKRTAGSLLRTSLRVPQRRRGTFGSRRGWRPFVLPTQRQAKRARRTLRLRSGVWLRRGTVWLAKTPARRWDRLWDRLPKAPLPITHYTEKQKMKTPAGPKHKISGPGPSPTPTPPDNVIPINRKAQQSMANNPYEQIIEAFQALAAFEPQGARDVELLLLQHQEMLAAVGHSYGILADRMRDSMPFAAPVADSVREIGVAMASIGEIAQSAHQTLRVAHEPDIRRYEDPRPGEDLWNPENNR